MTLSLSLFLSLIATTETFIVSPPGKHKGELP
jgi:hypothetical protein